MNAQLLRASKEPMNPKSEIRISKSEINSNEQGSNDQYPAGSVLRMLFRIYPIEAFGFASDFGMKTSFSPTPHALRRALLLVICCMAALFPSS